MAMEHCNAIASSLLSLSGSLVDSAFERSNSYLLNSLPLLRQVMRHTREGIAIMDSCGHIQVVNAAFCGLSALEAGQLIGRHITEINSDVHLQRDYQDIWLALQHQDYWQGEVAHDTGGARAITHSLTLQRVQDATGQVSHIVGILDDISQLKYSQAQLSYLAHHDALTGCANRAFLLSWFNKLTTTWSDDEQLALLFIDLDRFKPINDSFGHEVGDLVLSVLAKRLQKIADVNELVARIGGDEFVMVQRGALDKNSLQTQANRVLEALSAPVLIDNYVLNVGASIGISLYPEHGQDIESLLRYADIAMYQAKRYGHCKMCLFDNSQLDKLDREQRLVSECGAALEQHDFFLQYQPVFALDGQSLISLEVLLRWRHPELGVLYPDQILPAMKAAGLLSDLSEWVFITAADQLRHWQSQYQWQGRVSINLSGLELEQLKAEQLLVRLQQLGAKPEQFNLELCSDYMMQGSGSLSETVACLRAAGMKVYLDKLGLGKFNFSEFGTLPLDGIKMDAGLLAAPDSPWAETIIRSLVLLSKALDLTVIACGVEHHHHWLKIQAFGCDGAQGRLLAPPMMAFELKNPALLLSNVRDVQSKRITPLVDA